MSSSIPTSPVLDAITVDADDQRRAPRGLLWLGAASWVVLAILLVRLAVSMQATFLPLPRLIAAITPDLPAFRRAFFFLNTIGVLIVLLVVARHVDGGASPRPAVSTAPLALLCRLASSCPCRWATSSCCSSASRWWR